MLIGLNYNLCEFPRNEASFTEMMNNSGLQLELEITTQKDLKMLYRKENYFKNIRKLLCPVFKNFESAVGKIESNLY